MSIAHSDDAPSARLRDMVGEELHAIAVAYLRKERANHTLQPTALVNEAYLRLIDSTCIESSDRARFMSLAARAMRRVLVDFARKRKSDKRGGDAWKRVTLHPDLAPAGGEQFDLIELNDILTKFAVLDERAARVVELRFFGGLDHEETAEVLGVTERTIQNDWHIARTWLARELGRTKSS